jgi:EmrB/QacA subfamily drug resistance transporter
VTPPARPRLLLALLCSGQFLVVLDMTIVNVALPSMQAELGISSANSHWVMTAYAIAFGGFLLVGGRAADAFGRRRVLIAGAALFTAASLACSLAPTGSLLIAARGVQGVGGALLSTSAFGILAATFAAGAARAKAFATWASIGSFGAVAGFVVGGVLTQILGWRAIFLISVPVGCILVGAARRVLPESRGVRTSVDIPAAALATSGVAILAFVVSSDAGFGVEAVSLVAIALAALTGFALRERHSERPLLPSGLLRDRSFLTASAAGVAYGSSMLGVLMLLAVYLQTARGLSALETGVLMLLLRVPAIGWARLAGRLVGRFGPFPFLLLGTALFASGLLLLAGLPADGPFAGRLAAGLLVLGAAIPCLAVSVSTAALQGVRQADAGAGSGLLTTFQWVGGALGFAIVTAIAGDAHTGGRAEVAETVHAGFIACAVLCLGAFALALALGTRPRTAAAATA